MNIGSRRHGAGGFFVVHRIVDIGDRCGTLKFSGGNAGYDIGTDICPLPVEPDGSGNRSGFFVSASCSGWCAAFPLFRFDIHSGMRFPLPVQQPDAMQLEGPVRSPGLYICISSKQVEEIDMKITFAGLTDTERKIAEQKVRSALGKPNGGLEVLPGIPMPADEGVVAIIYGTDKELGGAKQKCALVDAVYEQVSPIATARRAVTCRLENGLTSRSRGPLT